MSKELLTLMIGALVPLSGFIAWFFDRRHKKPNSVQESNAAAMTAVTEASHTVVDMVNDLMAPLQDRLDHQELQIHDNDAHIRKIENESATQQYHIKRLEARMDIVVNYAKSLRSQLVKSGIKPLPFPIELEELYKESP